MENLKNMKHCLEKCVEEQMAHLESVDTKELGEAIDMIKDLAEAIYYCTVTKAMEEGSNEQRNGNQEGATSHYYGGDDYRYRQYPYYSENRDMDRYTDNKMYYSDSSNRNRSMSTSASYDSREGRSPQSRKMYMETKETHQDKGAQMRELEKYTQELTQDIVEMVEDASPEERQFLSKKISALAQKVQQMDDKH